MPNPMSRDQYREKRRKGANAISGSRSVSKLFQREGQHTDVLKAESKKAAQWMREDWAELADRKLREERAVSEFGMAPIAGRVTADEADVYFEARRMLLKHETTVEELRELVKNKPDLRKALQNLIK